MPDGMAAACAKCQVAKGLAPGIATMESAMRLSIRPTRTVVVLAVSIVRFGDVAAQVWQWLEAHDPARRTLAVVASARVLGFAVGSAATWNSWSVPLANVAESR